MTDFVQKYVRWVVIAGASEGIGASLADQLATRGMDLVLIARNGPLLEEVAARAREEHGVQTRVVVQDLTDPDVGAKVATATDGLDVGLLIYNASIENATMNPRLITQVRLFYEGKEIFAGKESPYDPGRQTDLKRLALTGGLSLGTDMVSGDYVLQVIVTDLLADKKHQSATQWMDFQIVD